SCSSCMTNTVCHRMDKVAKKSELSTNFKLPFDLILENASIDSTGNPLEVPIEICLFLLLSDVEMQVHVPRAQFADRVDSLVARIFGHRKAENQTWQAAHEFDENARCEGESIKGLNPLYC